ncbi:MAG: damage-inducible protein DinB [Acidobacteria bacterium]|nr:damage-inducible protein DinB [Acidobacteriota bacterium]
MAIKDSLLPEFDTEMATTRRVIERLREDRYGWAPHEKSTKAGRLASHITEMVAWGTFGITRDSLDLAGGHEPFNAASRSELLAAFDSNVGECRKAIEGAGDETMMQPWSLMNGENAIMTLPRIAVLRSLVLNHIIHHRGQMSVYLRLTGTAVPSIYGPSADEGGA